MRRSPEGQVAKGNMPCKIYKLIVFIQMRWGARSEGAQPSLLMNSHALQWEPYSRPSLYTHMQRHHIRC